MLTEREQEILRLHKSGASPQDISLKLKIGVPLVQVSLGQIARRKIAEEAQHENRNHHQEANAQGRSH